MLSLRRQKHLQMADNNTYDDEPVWYCRECLSLAIVDAGGRDYCKACGCTDTVPAPFERWEWLYRNKYGKPLIDKKKPQDGSR